MSRKKPPVAEAPPPPAEKSAKDADRARPVFEAKMGRIRASVWANQSEQGIRFSVSVSRLYKDQSGNWKTATSFNRDDLPLLMEAVRRAWEWTWSDDAYRVWSGESGKPDAPQALPAEEPIRDENIPF